MRAEVNEHEHDLLLDEVRPHVKEIDGHVHVRSASCVTWHRCMCTACLEAHELEDHPSGCVVEPGQAVHRKGKKKIKKGDMEGANSRNAPEVS